MKRRDFLRLTAGVLPAGLRPCRWRGPSHAPPAAGLEPGRIADPDYVIVGAGFLRLRARRSALRRCEGAGRGARSRSLRRSGPGHHHAWALEWLLGSSYDWNYRTEAVAGLGDRRIAFPRGKALGGSSAINAMTHIRGHRLCFDRWLELGNPGWGYDDVLPLFKRSERNESGPSEPAAATVHSRSASAGIRTMRIARSSPPPSTPATGPTRALTSTRPTRSASPAITRRTSSMAAATARPPRSSCRRCPSQHRGALARDRHAPGRGRHACGGHRVPARRTARRGAGRARSGALGRGRGLAPAADALGIGPADHLKSSGVAVVADVPGVGQNFRIT